MAWYPPPRIHPPGGTANYEWSLHQERMYLLSTLAAEEARGERYYLSLQATRDKLQAALQVDDTPDEDIKNLKRAAGGLSRKLKNCQTSQRIMANNLATVNSRITSTEQHRWRRLQFDYQQAQNIPQVMIGMENLNISSSNPYPQSMYHQQAYIPSFPQTHASTASPTPLTLQTAPLQYGQSWDSPFYTPTHQHCQTFSPLSPLPPQQYPMQQQQPALSSPTSWSFIDGVTNADPFASVSVPPLRRMSLPAKLQSGLSGKSSQESASPLHAIDEESEPMVMSMEPQGRFEMGRRLSLAGAGSAGLRLDRISGE